MSREYVNLSFLLLVLLFPCFFFFKQLLLNLIETPSTCLIWAHPLLLHGFHARVALLDFQAIAFYFNCVHFFLIIYRLSYS